MLHDLYRKGDERTADIIRELQQLGYRVTLSDAERSVTVERVRT